MPGCSIFGLVQEDYGIHYRCSLADNGGPGWRPHRQAAPRALAMAFNCRLDAPGNQRECPSGQDCEAARSNIVGAPPSAPRCVVSLLCRLQSPSGVSAQGRGRFTLATVRNGGTEDPPTVSRKSRQFGTERLDWKGAKGADPKKEIPRGGGQPGVDRQSIARMAEKPLAQFVGRRLAPLVPPARPMAHPHQ